MTYLASARGWMLLCALVLAACGGSAGSGPRIIPATAEERKAALDTLGPMVAALPAGNVAGNTAALVQAIKASPAFSDAGTSAGGTVWGLFRGGMLLFVMQGAPVERASPLAPPSGGWAQPTVVGGAASASDTSVPRPATLTAAFRRASVAAAPKSSSVRLFSGLGGGFDSFDTRQEISAMLRAKGYSVTIADATLANLRAVSGDGVFYLRSHGALGTAADKKTKLYALWTASPVLDPDSEKKEAALLDDLAQQRVVYMLWRNDEWPLLSSVLPQVGHYGITGGFVSAYMSFGEDSLAYVDACESAGDADFGQAFASKNASVYAGWDERALVSVLGKTARYVFDRLLGANKFDAETPHQRPFSYDSLPQDPRFGPGKAYGYSLSTLSDGKTPVAANLAFYPLGHGKFGALAPSIWSLQVDEADDELRLMGAFGPDPGSDGKVIIDAGGGETALAVIEWQADGAVIRAHVPRKGSGSSGNVIVWVRGHPSNTRQVLAWDATLQNQLQTSGTLTQRFELDVRLRIDPQDVRDQPGATPHPTPFMLGTPNLDMTTRFEASGTNTEVAAPCTFTTTWAGSGSIPASLLAGERFYIYAGLVDRNAGIATFGALAADAHGGEVTYVQDCPPPGERLTLRSPLAVSTVLQQFYVPQKAGVDFSLDASLAIASGSRQLSQGPTTYTLHWPAISPNPAYDDTLPR